MKDPMLRSESFARSSLEFGKCVTWSADECRHAEDTEPFGAGRCCRSCRVCGGSEHDEVDGSVATEVEEFFCGKICAEMVHVPVVFA